MCIKLLICKPYIGNLSSCYLNKSTDNNVDLNVVKLNPAINVIARTCLFNNKKIFLTFWICVLV